MTKGEAQGLILRPARAEDGAAIYALNRDALGYDFALADTSARLADILARPENHVLVAQTGGRVLGYAHAAHYDCTYCAPLKNLMALAVATNAQGQGVGRALLAAVEAWAAAEGAAGVRLSSGMDREGAHRFYEACGYALRKEHKNFIKVF